MSVQLANNMVTMPGDFFATSLGQNDNAPTDSSVLVITTTNTGDSLTGVVQDIDPTLNPLLFLINDGPNTLTIPTATGSTAGFQFILAPWSTLTLPIHTSQLFFFVPGTGWLPYLLGTFS